MATRQTMYVQKDNETHSCNHACRQKAISIIYYERVSVAFDIQHAKRRRRIIASLWPLRLYHNYPHTSTKGTISGKKGYWTKNCVLIFTTTFSETFLIPTIVQQGTIITVHRSKVKYPLILSDFNETWIFSTDFRKTLKFQISWKSVQWECSCCMRTDMYDEASSRVTQFCDAPTKTCYVENG